ncbi:gamma-glutamyl-gamma-aminobutyrate hydrolase family protein [Irregularibacter muris]|uniref:Gamma-glutamyl-gamma-aminobutyrate hydrolase family protein n=1 Tax=Irregularibacter muris TaxID=1796619 RepID=A0AAE3HF51_9FIRM|nr:gamma-glutamyl-gamma-aminobutyrate hydrolase family protein [Irregularibacter muris]MCR1899410.1 gamma-glutamyl-gamma-aminobutyrate hydrolase family protein [Irregularibacter muris]
MKPIVGVTCSCDLHYKKQYKETNYCEALRQVGAIPVLVPVLSYSKEDLAQLLQKLDGIVLTGGYDIHPIHFEEEPRQGLGPVVPERDTLELALVQECIERELPLFGVCRGLQVLNIALGGDLYQDIYRQIKSREILQHNHSSEGELVIHSIDIDNDSFLYDIFQQKIGWVNSFHHQAIRNVASSLVPVAWSKDGLIEAVQHRDIPSIFAVQWHPEKMWDRDAFSLKLFEHFMGFLKKPMVIA